MKTLIELFDSCQFLNILAGIRFQPEKIVFVGYASVMNQQRKESIHKFFKLRNQSVILEFVEIERYAYDSVLETLNTIIDQNTDCCFDLTGGKELALVAIGEIAAGKNVPMIQFDPKNGRFIRIKNAQAIAEPQKRSVSIREAVVLNGGEIVSPPDWCYGWNLNEDFRRDIRRIRDISRKNCTEWNQFTIALESLVPSYELHTGLLVSADLNDLPEAKQKILKESSFLHELSRAGILEDVQLKCSNVQLKCSKLKFRYKNNQVKRALAKAGNILELYVYLVAHEIAEEHSDFFGDIGIGVMIDWDGKLSDIKTVETRNEIDVCLMRGMIPLFISCKNGEVHKEALYELFSVAQRFGGEYAKKFLVTNDVSSASVTRKYVMQRAKDMQIEIIDSMDKMSHEEVKALFRKMML